MGVEKGWIELAFPAASDWRSRFIHGYKSDKKVEDRKRVVQMEGECSMIASVFSADGKQPGESIASLSGVYLCLQYNWASKKCLSFSNSSSWEREAFLFWVTTWLLCFLLWDEFWKPNFSIFRPAAEKKAFLLQGYRPFMLLAYQKYCLLQKTFSFSSGS